MPKVLKAALKKTPNSETKDVDAFPVDFYSASSMRKFSSNPLLFKIFYINRDRFETVQNASGVLGKAFHYAMEVYCGGSDTLIPTNEAEAIEYGLRAGMDYIDKYNDGFINYTKTIANKQKLFDLLTFCFNAYVKEMPYEAGTIVAVEDKILEKIDVEWRGARLNLPVKLKGYIDLVKREDGKLKIYDYKTCYTFSNPEKIDGAKILQAVEYYLLAYAKYGEEPYSVTFEEIKYTKNSDGGKQVREYEIVFAENELYFDFFFRFYEDMTRALNGEQVYVPNVETMYDNEVGIIAYIHRLDVPQTAADLMKKHKVDNITDLLKKEIQSAGNMRKLMKTVEENFVSAKNLNYDKMQNHEKIQTKLLEHGMMLQFDSLIQGATVDLYQYTPSIGLKMSRLKNYAEDIEQVLGISGVRVLAPIPNSTMVGFEVPRAERTFPPIPALSGFDIAIGQTIMGTVRRFDIRQAPHILVAGSTGAGKSVMLNSIIHQIKGLGELYLFDPKKVELAQWESVAKEYKTEADEITGSLADLVIEMEERYKELKKLGKKDVEGTSLGYKFVVIDEFGDLIAQNPEGWEYWTFCDRHAKFNKNGDLSKLMTTKRKLRVKEQEIVDSVLYCDQNEPCEKHVIPSFEQSLLRLVQKGRAAGIHVVVATQSPRADVIKGNIKANFPVKIALRTSKQIDSFVILDQEGAEMLKGKGDMLFSSPDGIERLQGYNI